MTDPDVLDCKIHELKEVQRTAWRQLADSSLTTFERREVRNQIRQSDNELRQYLQMMSERVFAFGCALPKKLLTGSGNLTFDFLP
jgi:hypothetical protein